MLILFEGGFNSAIHRELIEAIKKSITEGNRVFLIVPEQQTVSAECELSEELPPDAPLYFEVTNFTRFTNTVFREIGGVSGEYCRESFKPLIMWRVLTELSPMLAMTRGSKVISEGRVRRALDAIGEMQALGIEPDALTDLLSDDISDRRLREKISDLSMIYALYARLLGERYSDHSTDAQALARMLERDSSFLRECDIYIDGFTSFTEPQYKLIGALIKASKTTVALTVDKISDAFEYAELDKTHTRLTALADSVGIEKRLKKFTGRAQDRTGVIGEICDLLWRTSGTIDNDSLQELANDKEKVRIFEAETAYDECDFIAADIKGRVMAGAKYSDIAIVARRTDDYLGILDYALEGHGIPHFISKNTDVASIPLFKLISTAYKIITTGFRREDIITYLKCGILSIEDDKIDRFELYTEKWGIDGGSFSSSSPWNMNPRGYEAQKEGDIELITELNATRVKIIEPLIVLKEDARIAETVKDHALALLKFLKTIEAEEAMARRSEELSAMKDAATADESGRAFGMLCDALDAVVLILGDTPSDAPSFISQLNTALSGASVGRIPMLIDSVTVGSADMLRARGIKHVYLLGVNAGEFPASVSESSYFIKSEKLKLSNLGLPIEPDLEIKSAREFYCFSRAFALGSSSVTLTYVARTPMLAPLLPSDVIARIKEITRGAVFPIKISALKQSDLLYSPSITMEALGSLSLEDAAGARDALIKSGYGEMLRVADGSIKNNLISLDAESTALLYKKDLYLSQSKIDKFLGCPMNYFLKYSLHLTENEPAELSANVIGTFVHAVIESFFAELEESGRSAATLSADERESVTRRAAERYTKELLGSTEASERTRVAISRLARATKPVVDGLCEELMGCGYKPRFFELETTSRQDGNPDHLVIEREDGGRIIVRGTIDRVDTLKSGDDVYVRVLDYKTGGIDFSPEKLKDGEYLQMFLYLKAITDTKSPEFLEKAGVGKGGKIIPAGVIYVKTKVKDTTVRQSDDSEAEAAVKKLQERDGMLLDDATSLNAMNTDFIPPSEKRKTSLRYDKDGWAEIEKTLVDVTRTIADSMCSGTVSATPATKGGRNCKWCKYKAICRSAVIKNDF